MWARNEEAADMNTQVQFSDQHDNHRRKVFPFD
jgi:hypothetical protein